VNILRPSLYNRDCVLKINFSKNKKLIVIVGCVLSALASLNFIYTGLMFAALAEVPHSDVNSIRRGVYIWVLTGLIFFILSVYLFILRKKFK
jgi:hypothetical protein